MPETIKSAHIIFTLIAVGILLGTGFSLAQLAIAWPANRVASAAAIICLLLIVIAWLV